MTACVVDKNTESVVLKVADPLAVREVLPNSKTLPHPQFNLAVHHTLESTKVLRNMGFDVPAPIRHHYPWPGRYSPYEHQIQMSEFLTLHRRCFNLSEMGCVDADTEYLSPFGWRRIADYAGGDVAQYLPDTGEIEFVTNPEFVKLPCEEMIRFKTTHGVDQLLSREHRVLLADGRVVSAQHVLDHYGSQSLEARSHRFRTTFRPRGVEGVPLTDAEIRVQVAANADGYFEPGRNCAVVRIKKPRKIARMRELLVAAGITFTEHPAQPEGFVRFRFTPPLAKGFDAVWWAATAEQLEVVADEAPRWDGTLRKVGGVSFFGTRRDADFVQYAFAASGHRSTIRQLPDCVAVAAKAGDPTVGMVQRNTTREPNVRVEPSTDGFKYCFMVPSTFLVFRRNGCVFASGNTMKTNGSLWAADWLMKTGRVRKALILSPLSTLESVWQNDIFETLPHRAAAILHGSKERRLKYLNVQADFYILNHDGIKINDVREAIRKRPDIDLVIVDEAGMFRNPSADKYKALAALVNNRPDMRLWMMTGTPCPNAPTDAWALARLVSPERVPKFASAFQRETMTKVGPFRWVPRIDAFEKAYDAMQPAIRFRKKDCISLPPVTTQNHTAQISTAQAQAVKQLKDNMVTNAVGGAQITAANAADQINKIRQVLCGALKDPATGNYLPIPHQGRLKALIDAIQSASAKVIVVVPFKGIIRLLAPEVEKAGFTCAVVNGDVTPAKRSEIFKAFKTQKDPHVLLCHPAVMAHGLNLTEADVLIFYAPIYSNDEVEQVNERFNRAGQTRAMTIVRIGMHPIEWQIYKMTDTRKQAQMSILDLYNNVVQGVV